MSDGAERLRASREEQLKRITQPSAPAPITDPVKLNQEITTQQKGRVGSE